MVLCFIVAISAYFAFGLGGSLLEQIGELFGGGIEASTAGIVIFLIVLILGLIGAAIALAKPTVAGILMLVGGITMLVMVIIAMREELDAGVVGTEMILFAPGSIPLIIAGVLAIIARKEED